MNTKASDGINVSVVCAAAWWKHKELIALCPFNDLQDIMYITVLQ